MNTLPSSVRYSHLTWNCPLSEPASERLLTHLQLGPDTSIVDIGCGWGELVLRAAKASGAAAVGVEIEADLLGRARATAAARNLKVHFVDTPGNQWDEVRERAICIGSSHAFGGTKKMLAGLTKIVPKGGRVLIGDMCWERPPSQECLDMFGDEVSPLKDIVVMCREAGWKLMYMETATQQDWDAFESGHRAGAREWLLKNESDERAASVEEDLAKKEDGYFGVYRGQLGFVFAILAR